MFTHFRSINSSANNYICLKNNSLKRSNFNFVSNQRNFTTTKTKEMKIDQVPILSDNYSYIISCEKNNQVAIVDPAEPQTVMGKVNEKKLNLETVLTTHKHWDHAGGNEELSKKYPSIQIIGPVHDNIPAVTKTVEDNDEFNILDGNLKVQVLYTPCHTRGHVLYYVTDLNSPQEPGALFSGDTLFVGGCGRFFEGDASMMQKAMDRIRELPPETRVYCGHEYTTKNLLFATSIESNNQDLNAKLEWAQQQRKQGKSTIPSTIGEELKYNPFMRTQLETLMNAVGTSDPISTMTTIRGLKDKF